MLNDDPGCNWGGLNGKSSPTTYSDINDKTTKVERSSPCPSCGDPGKRLGTYHLEDGRSRFECPRCHVVWWSPVENVGDVVAVPGAWWAPYADFLTDVRYEAVVSWDILHYGYHVGDRCYREPSESPEAIWARAELRPNPGSGGTS